MPFFGSSPSDYKILDTNIDGGNNTLSFVTTGIYNIGLGNNSLALVDTGRRNVAIGEATLSNITGGSDNVAVGYNALKSYAGSQVSGNVAIGARALEFHTSPSACIAIGREALVQSTGAGANDNIAIGDVALAGDVVSGGKNIGIGTLALSLLSSGSHNVAVGHQALADEDTGSGNTAIGYRAGVFAGAASNNILIGQGVTGAYGMNNTIQIGDASHTTITIGGINLVSAGASVFPKAIIGDAGTEGTGVNINGVLYESTFKVSDIDGTNFAQTILHRHSTVLEPLIVGARSNTDTTAHANVTPGMGVFSIFGTGWAGANYKIFGQEQFAADDTGTISNTSAPGKWTLSLTADGAVAPVPVITARNDKSVEFAGGIISASITWAALPPAATNTGKTFFVSDVGLNGGYFYSTGTEWVPTNEAMTLGCGAVPAGLPSSGSIAANGALTLTTAFPTIYASGIWLYFPAGAVYAGSLAGFYWTVMSTTTAGVIYNDRKDGATAWLPSTVGVNTPIVAAGPGAYAQTTLNVTVSTETLLGGLMGTLGALRGFNTVSLGGGANNRAVNSKLGGVGVNSATSTSVGTINQFVLTRNRGTANSQINNNYLGIQSFAIAGALSYSAINTAIDNAYVIDAQLTVATDFIIFESVIVELLR